MTYGRDLRSWPWLRHRPGCSRLPPRGDETAIPAVSQLLEALPAESYVQVHIEVAHAEAGLGLPDHPHATVAWCVQPAGARPGDAHVAAEPGTTGDSASERCFGPAAVGKSWSIDPSTGLVGGTRQVAALALWSGLAWVLLTWTASVEQAAYGLAVAVAVAVVLSPLGPVARPWRLLRPGRLVRLTAVAATSMARILAANVGLARRVWSPSLPIRTGMLVVPTDLKSDGTIAATGLLGSLIVDYQLVDLEPGRLQYHAVWVASEDPIEARERISGPLERLLRPFDEATDHE